MCIRDRQCPQTAEHFKPIFLQPQLAPQPFAQLQKIVFTNTPGAGGNKEMCIRDRYNITTIQIIILARELKHKNVKHGKNNETSFNNYI